MNIIKIILLNLLILTFSYASTFEDLSSKLSDNSFKVKEEVLNELIVNYKEEDKLETLLQNMLAGNLYFNPTTNEILISQNENFKSLFTYKYLFYKKKSELFDTCTVFVYIYD